MSGGELATKADLERGMSALRRDGKADLESGLTGLRNEMHAEFSKVREEMGGLRGEMGGFRRELGGLNQDIGVLKQDVSVLKQDVSVLKQDVSVLKQDVGVLKQDVGGLRQEMTGLREEIYEVGRTIVRDLSRVIRGEKDEVAGDLERERNRAVQVEDGLAERLGSQQRALNDLDARHAGRLEDHDRRLRDLESDREEPPA